jgi:hypothetical protein
MGKYVSEYALALTYKQGLNVEKAKYLAAFCIKAAKDHAVSCGGKTHVHTIQGDGDIRIIDKEKVNAAEDYSRGLFDITRHVLDYLDTRGITNDEAVGPIVEHLKNTIIRFRKQDRLKRAAYEKKQLALKRPAK